MIKKEGNMSCVALIPARSGSKRIKNKNIKILGKHPLIAYSIAACLRSKIFDKRFQSKKDKHISIKEI